MNPPRPGVKYTAAQMEQMRKAYPDFVMPGYAMRIDDDGMFSFIPWSQASGGGHREDGTSGLQEIVSDKVYVPNHDPFEKPPPIVKRTPQQRLESLANSLMDDVKKYGRLPGVNDELTRALVGESWRAGTPMSAEDVRAAAATLLGQAENTFEASERKKVVRTSPTD